MFTRLHFHNFKGVLFFSGFGGACFLRWWFWGLLQRWLEGCPWQVLFLNFIQRRQCGTLEGGEKKK